MNSGVLTLHEKKLNALLRCTGFEITMKNHSEGETGDALKAETITPETMKPETML